MPGFRSYTATQLGYKAQRHLGILRPGQSGSPDTNNDILSELNDMLDAWQLDRRKVFAIRADQYNLIGGVQFYFIGQGATGSVINGVQYGAFNTQRPTEIEDANLIINTAGAQPPVRKPIEIVTAQQWAAIAVQQIPFALPLKLWYDNNFTSGGTTFTGFGVISLWPGPLTAYQIELFTTQNIGQLLTFADLMTAYSFPPGYADAITLSLAEKIAPMMQVYLKIKDPLTAEVKRQASAAREAIESYNAPSPMMMCDPAFRNANAGGFNYATGEIGGTNR